MLLIAGLKTTEAGVVKTEGVPIFEKRLIAGNNAVVIGYSAADGYPIPRCNAVGRAGGKLACGLAEAIVESGTKKRGPSFCPTRPEAHGIGFRRVGVVEGLDVSAETEFVHRRLGNAVKGSLGSNIRRI